MTSRHVVTQFGVAEEPRSCFTHIEDARRDVAAILAVESLWDADLACALDHLDAWLTRFAPPAAEPRRSVA